MASALNYLAGPSSGDRQPPKHTGRGATSRRVRPASMQLVAHLDDHYVELHILTDSGESIVISCPGDSIFALQQHIEQIRRQCPEIHGWNQTTGTETVTIDVTSTSVAKR